MRVYRVRACPQLVRSAHHTYICILSTHAPVAAATAICSDVPRRWCSARWGPLFRAPRMAGARSTCEYTLSCLRPPGVAVSYRTRYIGISGTRPGRRWWHTARSREPLAQSGRNGPPGLAGGTYLEYLHTYITERVPGLRAVYCAGTSQHRRIYIHTARRNLGGLDARAHRPPVRPFVRSSRRPQRIYIHT